MDTGKILALHEPVVALHVPGHVAGIRHDLLVRRRRDEALLLLRKVPLVGEGQRGPRLLQDLLRVLGRGLALWVEVLCLRGNVQSRREDHGNEHEGDL